MTLLWFYMAFHFLVDALCGATVLGPASFKQPEMLLAIVAIYNMLAFCTQFMTGVFCDEIGKDRLMFYLSAMFLIAGALLFMFPWGSAVSLGIGNSLFHVAAGREVIRTYSPVERACAWPLGAFVSPGALGICLGCLFPNAMYPISLALFVVLLVAFAIFSPVCQAERPQCSDMPKNANCILAVILVVFCVFCRAAAGGCIGMKWREFWQFSLALGVIMVLGKMLGGFVADKFGYCITGVLSLVISWILLSFFADILPLALLGQFAANLMMAVTLYMLVKLCPDKPGLMFGLAASVLYPGSLVKRFYSGPVTFTSLYFASILFFVVACVLLYVLNRRKHVS